MQQLTVFIQSQNKYMAAHSRLYVVRETQEVDFFGGVI